VCRQSIRRWRRQCSEILILSLRLQQKEFPSAVCFDQATRPSSLCCIIRGKLTTTSLQRVRNGRVDLPTQILGPAFPPLPVVKRAGPMSYTVRFSNNLPFFCRLTKPQITTDHIHCSSEVRLMLVCARARTAVEMGDFCAVESGEGVGVFFVGD
jgi:hypothetical protein